MSMVIGGYDLVLKAPKAACVRAILDMLADYWPHAVIEYLETDGTRPLREALEEDSLVDGDEFFVYRDAMAALTWEEEGLTENDNDAMIHFLVRNDQESQGIRITIVLHAITEDTAELFGVFRSVLRESSVRKSSDRCATTLRKAGCAMTQRRFEEVVNEVLQTYWPSWNDEDLVSHPRSALRFCAIVRRKVKAELADDVILRALSNSRKKSRKATG